MPPHVEERVLQDLFCLGAVLEDAADEREERGRPGVVEPRERPFVPFGDQLQVFAAQVTCGGVIHDAHDRTPWRPVPGAARRRAGSPPGRRREGHLFLRGQAVTRR